MFEYISIHNLLYRSKVTLRWLHQQLEQCKCNCLQTCSESHKQIQLIYLDITRKNRITRYRSELKETIDYIIHIALVSRKEQSTDHSCNLFHPRRIKDDSAHPIYRTRQNQDILIWSQSDWKYVATTGSEGRNKPAKGTILISCNNSITSSIFLQTHSQLVNVCSTPSDYHKDICFATHPMKPTFTPYCHRPKVWRIFKVLQNRHMSLNSWEHLSDSNFCKMEYIIWTWKPVFDAEIITEIDLHMDEVNWFMK